MERYQGKKVVIIGGTSGMGLATAKMLLDGGARVLVTGRSKAGLESAQKEIGKDAIVVSSDALRLASWFGPLRRFNLAHPGTLKVKRIEFRSAGA
jgi:NAD(P)-dependent dehydrogenase (short-subunit alcohol dehydrogenase family)